MEQSNELNVVNTTVEGTITPEKKKKKQLDVITPVGPEVVELPQDFWELKGKVDELINVVERLKNHTHDGNGAKPQL